MADLWLYTLGSVLLVSSVSLVGVFTLAMQPERLARVLLYLVSFSAGALLGDVFLHILPEIMAGERAVASGAYILTGVILFFVLERALRWHHSHSSHEEEVHGAVYLTIVGDALHNFLDGIAIAAAFLISIPLGVATAIAVIFHEIPQEIGQFAILVHGGWSKRKALRYNFFSALTAVAGALVVLVFSANIEGATAVLLGLGAASFIYIAMADLLPELQKTRRTGQFALQLVSLAVDIAVMALLLPFA